MPDKENARVIMSWATYRMVAYEVLDSERERNRKTEIIIQEKEYDVITGAEHWPNVPLRNPWEAFARLGMCIIQKSVKLP